MKDVKISVITATFNVESTIEQLVESLKKQTDQDFEWIIADGGSIDNTLSLIKKGSEGLNFVLDSRPDFGIYDGLNRGIKLCSGDYYIVIGADDFFYPDAIEKYKRDILESGADIIAACIDLDGVVKCPKKSELSWLKGQMAFISGHSVGHSVGLAIRVKLHQKIGFYSNKFPIAADQLFILQAIQNGKVVIHHSKFTAGYFSREGISSIDYFGTVTEFFRVQVIVGKNKYIQLIILVLRLFKKIIFR
jgi:glycosyltransferase involved in cell wall biosynthesis